MKILRLASFLILMEIMTVPAFPDRVDDLANRLTQDSRSLSDESYRGFAGRNRANRADVEGLYLAHEFDAGAALFRRMVGDQRPDGELRVALTHLEDLARTSSRLTGNRTQWTGIQATLDELSRELTAERPGGGRREGGLGRRDDTGFGSVRNSGRARWRGMVDQEVHVVFRDNIATVQAIAGGQVHNPTFNFTSSLPRMAITLQLNKITGRGTVEILQQPSRNNDFTGVVRIYDPRSGAGDYEFEVIW